MSRIETEAQAINDLTLEWMKINKTEDWDIAIKELFSYGIKNPYYKW